MPRPGDVGFADRRKAALEAKAQLIEKMKSAPKPDDPEVQAKLAERKALAEARDARHAERARIKAEEKAEAERIKALIVKETAANKVLREAAEAAERKAERDRRYAARKARQR